MDQADLELMEILLPQLSGFQDYRCESLCKAFIIVCAVGILLLLLRPFQKKCGCGCVGCTCVSTRLCVCV